MSAKNGAGHATAQTASEARKIDTGESSSRSFKPQTHASQVRTNRKRYKAALDNLLLLRKKFPEAIARLDLPRRHPLKVGISADIAAALPELSLNEIRLALQVYVTGTAYLRSCTEGAQRIALNGVPAGSVTADEAAYAKKLLDKIESRNQRRSKAPRPAPVSPPQPKKLSLADLRSAAAARKRTATAEA